MNGIWEVCILEYALMTAVKISSSHGSGYNNNFLEISIANTKVFAL